MVLEKNMTCEELALCGGFRPVLRIVHGDFFELKLWRGFDGTVVQDVKNYFKIKICVENEKDF